MSELEEAIAELRADIAAMRAERDEWQASLASIEAARQEALDEIERLRAALERIADHDSGMKPDFSNAAKQAAIAREALAG